MFLLVLGGIFSYDCANSSPYCLPKTYGEKHELMCYSDAVRVLPPLPHRLAALLVQLTGPPGIPYYLTPMIFCLTSHNGFASICLPVQNQTSAFLFKGPLEPSVRGFLYYGLHNETTRTFRTQQSVSSREFDFIVPQRITVDVTAEMKY